MDVEFNLMSHYYRCYHVKHGDQSVQLSASLSHLFKSPQIGRHKSADPSLILLKMVMELLLVIGGVWN